MPTGVVYMGRLNEQREFLFVSEQDLAEIGNFIAHMVDRILTNKMKGSN